MINYKSKIYHLYESEELSMDFLDKLERKFGNFSIPNLMLYIMIGQGCVLLCSMLLPGFDYLNILAFNPYLIARGQIWRLISYIFIPTSTNLFFFLFAILLYTYLGRTLEHAWGTFKLNIYYLSGMIFNILGLFIIQKVFYNHPAITQQFYYLSSLRITYYLNLSLFLAFAVLFPDMEFQLYFVIPIKVKYLALFDVALIVLDFISGKMVSRVLIILSLLNFLIFFGARLRGKGHLTKTQKNFRAYQNGASSRTLKQGPPIKVAFHKCTVCGKTELTDPDMEFRYCSKCNGNYEYCMDHLRDHTHIE